MEAKFKYIIAAIVVLVVIIAGLGIGLHLFNPQKSAGNTLTIASLASPSSLDPAVAFDTNSVFFDNQIYQTLVGYGTKTVNGTTVGTLTPVPELATNWTVYSNGSVLFNLRQNVTFANGDPFNSTAVQFTLDRLIEMKQGADFHVFSFLNASGIHVLGKYKIMLVPSAPYPWFLNLFQLWVTGIVDPNYVNAHGGVQAKQVNPYMATHAMGTGPYQLNYYGTSQIVLTANPNYSGPAPNVKQIVYEIVPSPATQQTLLEKGSVNIALNIPLSQMSSLKNYTNLKIKSGPTSSEFYIGMCENVTPFDNLSVRKAIEYAVNTTALTNYSTYGFGLPIKSVMAPSIEAYTPAFQNYTLNLSKARFYLNQSAYPKGFSTNFSYIAGDPVGTAIGTILQQELAKINITISLHSYSSSTFATEVGTGHWGLFYEGWVNLLATPDDGIRPLFNAANIGIYGNFNYFNNTTVSHDLVKAGTLYNQSQRDALYIEAQKIIADQAGEVPLFNMQNVIPMTTNVHDLYIYPTFDIFVSQIRMS